MPNIAELGDKHVQENPALLSLSVLFFRWHNYLVGRHNSQEPHGFDETFSKTRHWVIASLQVYSIIISYMIAFFIFSE